MSFEEKDFWVQIIELYKELDCLWDIKSKDYFNKKVRCRAYEKLIRKAKERYPSADINFVKKKINSLRASFRRQYRKLQGTWPNRGSSKDVTEPTLWYYDLLTFTIDEEDELPDDSSLRSPGEVIQEENESTVQDRNDVEVKQERPETPIDPLSTDNGHVPESTRVKTVNHIRRRRTPQELTEAGHTLNAALGTLNKVLLQQGKKHEQEKDECDLYGELLAKKLRRLPYNERLSLMHEIDGMFIRRLSENTTVLEVSPSLSAHQVRPGSASSYSEAMAVDPLSSAASLYSEPMDRQ